ncbi:MAG: acetylxylan esterase [Planctomycetes bacterium]|nr:acetylxylan esterase [Planctomycetota bacterium]
MQLIDQQIAEYQKLDVPATKQTDFDEFWAAAVAKARSAPLNARGGPVEYPWPGVEVQDLTYEGLDGTAIRAWLLLPPQARNSKVPAVVCFHGYTGSRGYPSSHAQWLLAGAAVVAHDFRMQGGLTGSNTGFMGGRGMAGFVFGVLDRDASYLYHATTDALRAIELALTCPKIDRNRICVQGGSQGGAMALTTAALHPAASLCMADVPSNCWFEKRIFDRSGSVSEVAQFLRDNPDKIDQVCRTLSYYDNINLAGRIRCPVLVSLGLKDPVCPPANVYAAFNKIAAPKTICPYPFGEHDGGGNVHNEIKLRFLRDHFFK